MLAASWGKPDVAQNPQGFNVKKPQEKPHSFWRCQSSISGEKDYWKFTLPSQPLLSFFLRFPIPSLPSCKDPFFAATSLHGVTVFLINMHMYAVMQLSNSRYLPFA